MKKLLFILMAFLAPLARAGDMLEGYLFVVGTIPATLAVAQETDLAKPEFRETIAALSAEWSEKCSARVDIWHTALISSDQSYWPADMWVAYLAFEETAEASRAAAPFSPCLNGGYTQHGFMVFPSIYQLCAMGDDGSDLYRQTCN